MIDGLRSNGVEVIECQEPLWHGFDDRERVASGEWASFAFLRRVLRTYTRLLLRYVHLSKRFDVMVVGYPGQFDVLLARLLSWAGRKPLAWDIFMSIYLITLERQLDQRSRFTAGLIRTAEQIACRLPDLLILDTSAYVAWFGATYGITADRFRLVPTGADDRIFGAVSSGSHEGPLFRVLYYGTFIRNHGVEHIIEAARLLAGDPTIQFELIGDGPERGRAIGLARQYGLRNLTFIEWLPKPDLAARAAKADLCLGAFGTTPQSLMTVQNKIYEAMAMARPIVTGDSPAVREVLSDGEHVFLCARANPSALAETICFLRDHPEVRQRVAQGGHDRFVAAFDVGHIGARFAAHLRELVARSGK